MVLERDTVAGGASGRNGGFLLAGMAAFYVGRARALRARRARRIYARTLEAQEEIYALAAELGAGDAVRRTGLLRVPALRGGGRARAPARRRPARGRLSRRARRARRAAAGAAARFALNACLTEHDGALQPARWIRALARAAERAGARIHEGTAVAGPVPAPGEGELRTPGGSVARRGTWSWPPTVRCPRSCPTTPPACARGGCTWSPPRRCRSALMDRLVYSRWGYEYFQQRPGRPRCLAGGFCDLDGEGSYTDRDEGSPAVWERIERYLATTSGVGGRDHAPLGRARRLQRRRAAVRRRGAGRPGLYVAGGYSGHGNVPGFVAGRQIADAIAGVAVSPAVPPTPTR